MTKEIELAAKAGAKERYPQTDYMTFLDIVNSDTDRLIYETGFKDCAQWMATRDPWNKYPDVKPTEYGHYEVFRAGVDNQHYETWNNTGWAYNNRDITHWRNKVRPDGTVMR